MKARYTTFANGNERYKSHEIHFKYVVYRTTGYNRHENIIVANLPQLFPVSVSSTFRCCVLLW